MAELVPYPFDRLLRRMFTELERHGSIFDLPRKKFVTSSGRDLSVRFHGHEAATPLGPAAGPQSQLAQNVVLSFLGGGRIFELKTVQIMDTLSIPRPCIDMQTVGYNVEWSQELKLEQSLEEYVKASMLLEILIASGKLGLAPGFERFVFDMSVGYDLAGIQSPRVSAFLEGMLDASDVVARLRKQIPEEYKQYRDLDFRTRISDTLTLSTFHGCPPEEIEKIIDFLLKSWGLHCIVKLNPTLLGAEEARRIFNGVLGYPEKIPDTAFEKDTRWEQACGFVERLGATAEGMGLGFGVKFSNTLIVKNERDFFPKTEKEMYLSGAPLHVLAMTLVSRFRETFGDKYPISFSAGVDRANFADSVANGVVPVTTCSDLLKPGGYGRMPFYFLDIARRMEAVKANDVEELVLLGRGKAEEALELACKEVFGAYHGEARAKNTALSLAQRMDISGKIVTDARANPPPKCCDDHEYSDDLRTVAGETFFKAWVSAAKILNAKDYAAALAADARYKNEANRKLPPKVGTKLTLFNCITCDKCVPVCPNDANFTYTLPKATIPVVKMRPGSQIAWEKVEAAPLVFDKKHQLANFADFCNECGNCDVFCPEDGGPYVMKPRFFGSREQWAHWKQRDGFFLEKANGTQTVLGRFAGKEMTLVLAGGRATYTGDGFEARFAESDPEGTFEATGTVEIDLTYFHVMNWIRKALLESDDVNYVTA